MAITRPFAYNTGSAIAGTAQHGSVAVGTTIRDYSNYGNVEWFMGPDETRGYVVPHAVPGRPKNMGLLGANGFSESNFLNAVNKGLGTAYTAGYTAYNNLSGSYYMNYRPIVSDGLVLDLDASNLYSYPGSGTTWTSTTGSLNGSLTNGPSFSTDGSGSIVFDGVDDYIQINNQIQFERTNSFSFNIWFNFANNNFMQLINNQNSSYIGYELAKSPTTNLLYLLLGRASTSNHIIVTTANPLILNTWLNVCVTYNGTSSASGIKIYLNGSTVETTTGQDTIGTQTTISNAQTLIGRRNPQTQGPFNGKIPSVQIYNRALTAQEVLQNYTAQATRFGHTSLVTKGLITYYDIQNPASYPGSGTTIYDISGNSNNCTLVNGPTYSTDGSGSIDFDGVDDYGEITVPSYLKSNSYSTITISAWVKWKTTTTGMMLGFQTYDVWLIDSRIGYNNGQSNQVGISSTQTTNLGLIGNWKYYTFVMNSYGKLTGNEMYINGVKQSITPVREADGDTLQFTDLRLASWLNGSYNGPVRYADCAIYDRALSEGEILQNYNATKGRFGL